MNSPIFEQVRAIAADVFHVAPRDLTPDSAPEHLSAWDSIQHLNLLLALEQGFELQFEPEEIDQMQDLRTIAMLLEQRLGGNGVRTA